LGTYGASGYALAAWNGSSDLTSLSAGDSLSLIEGARFQWALSTSDIRALQSPDGTTREATCWYSTNGTLQLRLSFQSGYTGNLELYALDWDTTARTETIQVDSPGSLQRADLSSSFNPGAWTVFPVSVPTNGTVTITVTSTGGANAVLSGLFLG